jgi:hypothetical protein
MAKNEVERDIDFTIKWFVAFLASLSEPTPEPWEVSDLWVDAVTCHDLAIYRNPNAN